MDIQEQTSHISPDAPPDHTVALRDGTELHLYTLKCPLDSALREPVTALLNTEWPDGDFHWTESMAGSYAESLTVVMCPAMREGRWVGNATVAFAADSPEVGAVCDVLTHRDARGLGVAQAATQAVTRRAVEAGCRAVYLGTGRDGNAQRVYQRIGFEWFHGGVMRHLSPKDKDFDSTYFGPGQQTATRPAEWGDLPGTSALFGQPYAMLAGDYARGLFSPARTFHGRCVSVFPYIYYDVVAKSGVCRVLVGQTPHRILGLATMTPIDTAYRRHVGVVDVMTHDHFSEDGPRLLHDTIDSAREGGMRRAVAYVASTDTLKMQWVHDLGARSVGTLAEQIQVDEGPIDIELFELSL